MSWKWFHKDERICLVQKKKQPVSTKIQYKEEAHLLTFMRYNLYRCGSMHTKRDA